MATEKQSFTIRVGNDMYENLRAEANYNKRSLSCQVEFILERCMLEINNKRRRTAGAGEELEQRI